MSNEIQNAPTGTVVQQGGITAPSPFRFERHTAGLPAAPVEPKVEPAPVVTPAANGAATAPPPGAGTAPSGEEKPKPEPTQTQARDSARFAALTRQAKQLTERQQRFQAEQAHRESEFKAREERIESQSKELQRQLDEMKAARADPLKWLELGGHSYDAVAQQVINDGKAPPEVALGAMKTEIEQKLEKQRAEIDARLKVEEDARKKAIEDENARGAQENQAALQRFHQSALDFVTQHKEDYELTATLGQQNQVPALIQAYYLETEKQDATAAKSEGRRPTGKVLSFAEAAQMVEQFLEGQLQTASSTKKFLGRFSKIEQSATNESLAAGAAPAPAPVAAAPPAAAAEITPGQRPTLTNSMAQDASSKPGEYLTDDERWKRALAAMDAATAKVGVRR